MNIVVAKRWGIADTALALLAVLCFLWLGYQISEKLSYRWDWGAPLQYLVSRDESGWRGGLLLDGLLVSVRLMLIGGVLSLLIGGVVAAAMLSPIGVFRRLGRFYVEALRHLPPIVFMFVFFYFISAQLFAADWARALLAYADSGIGRFLLGDPALAENVIGGVLCLALFEAAFVAEILRGGVLSIAVGQWDAARGVGLPAWRVLSLVILPQVLARVAAPLTGQMVLLIKDSAILSVISVQEITFSAQETAVSTQQVFETWLLAALFYFILCWPLLSLSRRLERRGRD